MTTLPTAADLVKRSHAIMPLPEPYRSLFGDLPLKQQWTILLYGTPGSGKSTLSLQLADVVAKTLALPVLYCTNEESTQSNSLALRLRLAGIHNPRIEFCDSRSLHDVEQHLQRGRYSVCVIDSINNFYEPDIDVLRMSERFANVSFVFCGQIGKDRKLRSNAQWEHLVYAVYKTSIEDGVHLVQVTKSRYNPRVRQAVLFQDQ